MLYQRLLRLTGEFRQRCRAQEARPTKARSRRSGLLSPTSNAPDLSMFSAIGISLRMFLRHNPACNLIYLHEETRADTSRPGSSPSSLPSNSAPPSDHFGRLTDH